MIIIPNIAGSLPPATFKSAGFFSTTGSSSLSVSVDDILVLFACADQNVSITPASGWTELTGGGGVSGYTLAWRKATSTTVDLGTWTNAGVVVYGVFTGSGVGSYAATKNAGEANDGVTAVFSPAITLQKSDSQVMQWACGANFAGEAGISPSVYDTTNLTQRAFSGGTIIATRGATQNVPTGVSRQSGNKNTGSSLIRWRSATVEIIP